ncbi:ATP-grasp ribosomal peptide maturase [Symbioplanes lichenis]|uniref:ATP-grasp ribosomal peptide maturase n=1 Tax=Symbioplanes lichenis TaxID=1629072 RepID=UPI002738CA0C|nr:ATP-grasp ribosomal peptide maturase [Actinoplanes lichenis]
MGGRTVAVFTGDLDVTADAVIMELHRRDVPVVRCDPATFPAEIMLGARFCSGWTGHLRTGSRTLNLSDVACAWWRRPTPITIPGDVPEATWVRREAVAGLRGVLSALPWLNHPDDIRAADHKPLQLAVAAAAGLRVPATLVTNVPAEARAFAEDCGPVVYKPFTAGILDSGHVIYASAVDPRTLDDSISVTAHLFQQQIPKAYELRVTAVDGHLFTARIDATTDKGRTDWRSDYHNLRYSTYDLPVDVAAKLRTVLRRLRLRFGAFDLIATPGGEYVFLEVNPNGQWAWIEDETGLPIASALADALEKEK